MKQGKAIAMLLLALVLMVSAGCSSQKPIDLEEPVEQVPTAAELQASLEDGASTREVTLYYKDLMGYLVPVNCEIPWEEGIAKATLKQMISSEENDLQAARLGLLTALPEGLEVDMDIIGQLAKVSLSTECMQCVDAEEENAMVCAIVSALTEFDSISEVQILVAGEQVDQLTFGTDVSAPLTRADLNLESVSADVDTAGAGTVQVFFESEASGCMVPITRTVFSNEDIDTAVLELLKGPGASSPLESALPAGCGLIDVTRDKDGKVTINLTSEFSELINSTDGGRQALRSLALTCAQFPGVSGVEVLVNGQPFDEGASTMSVPSFVNDAETVADQFLQTQSRLLFGPDDE